MAFPPSATPTPNPQNAALSYPINLVQTTRDPGPADVSYTPGQSEWLNTSNGNYWKYKGVQIVSGSAQAVWELLTTVSATRDPLSSDNTYTVGTLWANTSNNDFWALTSISGSLAHWVSLTAQATGTVSQFTTQDLDSVLPDVNGNINIVGGSSGFLVTTGATANTITVKESGLLAALYGGTGSNTLNQRGVVIAQGSSTMTATAAATDGEVVTGRTGLDPIFAAIGTSSGLTNHGVVLGQGTGAFAATAAGTTGQVLIGSTAANPSFGALGVNSGLTQHGVLVAEGNSAFSATAAGTDGQLLVATTSADPAFSSTSSAAFTFSTSLECSSYTTLNIGFVKSASEPISADGTYGVAVCFAANAISGFLSLCYVGTGRTHQMEIFCDCGNFDFTKCALNLISNNSYLEEDVLTNLRIVSQDSDKTLWLLVDIANRNASNGTLSVVWHGNGNEAPILLPSLPGASTTAGTYGWYQNTDGSTTYKGGQLVIDTGSSGIGIGTSGPVVISGSGVPASSAAKGSLYLRTDGTGVNDRAYINTDGSTTWTAIVTVA